MLEKTEAGSSVLSSKSDAFFFERSASFVEAENLLANAGVAQSDSFVQLHDGETEDFPLRLEDLGDIGHAHAVAVIFDDGKNGTRSHTAGDFLDVMAQVFAVNLHPRIEGGIFRSGF